MRYKKFGNTGENLSVLCLGTWALGGKQFGAVTQEDAVAAVHAMIDCGVNIVHRSHLCLRWFRGGPWKGFTGGIP